MTIYFTRLIDWAAGTKYRAQDFDAEFDNVGNAFELVGAQIDAAALSVTTAGSNTTSTTSNSIGTGSKTWTVETSKSLVVGMHYKMADTASPSNWALGLITAYNSSTGSLTINVSDTSGSGTITAWTGSVSAPITRSVTRRALVGAGTVVASDNGGWIDATTGSWTLAWDAVATLGAGFCVIVRNSGTGDITHDFNSTETCDGLATFVQYPGEVRMFLGDASALRSIVLSGFNKTFTASGTFTKPPGYVQIGGFVVGPGGGGGSGRKTSTGVKGSGAGGSGGGWVKDQFQASVVGATETVTVGTGGAGGPSQTNNDTNGSAGSSGSGVSSFGALLSATAGAGGGGGTTGTNSAGAVGSGAAALSVAGTAGGVSTSGSPAVGTASTTTQACTGGGAGGGDDTGATYDGAAGGASGTTSSASQLAGGAAGAKGATGAAGSAGNTSTMYRGGTGGGGGGYGSSGNGGAGGAGVRGSGGGGGGACTNSGNSGAGGAGGDGVVVVWGIV